MPDVTFEYGEAKITVREQTGRDLLTKPYVLNEIQLAMAEGKGIDRDKLSNWEFADCIEFVPFLMRSTVNGDIGFTWPDDYETSSHAELYLALMKFMSSPRKLIEQWIDALERADMEKPDPEE